MWPKILRIYPTTKIANVTTYEMILIVASMVKTCRIRLMSTVLDARIIQRMNPSIFDKGSQKFKTILSTNKLQAYRNR